MTKLKELWDRIEKWAIYGILGLFIISQLLAIFVPSISSFVDRRGEIVLIAIVLLFIFRYLDEKLTGFVEKPLKTSNSFSSGLMSILSEHRDYNNIDVFALTGVMYARTVFESRVRVKNLRGLFRDMHGIGKNTLLMDDSSRHRQREELDAAILEWQQLHQQGFIEKLSLQYYPFDPMLNFIILDRKVAYIDLMKPQKGYPSATSRFAPTCYIVTNRTAEGRQLIDDLSTVFEQIWNEFKEI